MHSSSMAKLETGQADLVFKALSDPTRRQVMEVLSTGPLPAGEIASHFPISGPSVSRHLGVLRAAGLVAERREANRVIYSLAPEALVAVVGPWLARVSPDWLAGTGPPAGVQLAGHASGKPEKKKAPKAGKRKRKASQKLLCAGAGDKPVAGELVAGPGEEMTGAPAAG